jgi:hypothetical protein
MGVLPSVSKYSIGGYPISIPTVSVPDFKVKPDPDAFEHPVITTAERAHRTSAERANFFIFIHSSL